MTHTALACSPWAGTQGNCTSAVSGGILAGSAGSRLHYLVGKPDVIARIGSAEITSGLLVIRSNAPTLRWSHCQGFQLTDLHLSLRPKPFKCSSNGFDHRDFGSISQITGRLGAVQVLTRRHHRNG